MPGPDPPGGQARACQDPVSCARCGRGVDGPAPPTWSLERGERGRTWLCDTCTREHVRAIEARLDDAWW